LEYNEMEVSAKGGTESEAVKGGGQEDIQDSPPTVVQERVAG
jgi:hypothetical protein